MGLCGITCVKFLKIIKHYRIKSFIQLKIKNKIKYILKDKKNVLKIKNLVKIICKKIKSHHFSIRYFGI